MPFNIHSSSGSVDWSPAGGPHLYTAQFMHHGFHTFQAVSSKDFNPHFIACGTVYKALDWLTLTRNLIAGQDGRRIAFHSGLYSIVCSSVEG